MLVQHHFYMGVTIMNCHLGNCKKNVLEIYCAYINLWKQECTLKKLHACWWCLVDYTFQFINCKQNKINLKVTTAATITIGLKSSCKKMFSKFVMHINLWKQEEWTFEKTASIFIDANELHIPIPKIVNKIKSIEKSLVLLQLQ